MSPETEKLLADLRTAYNDELEAVLKQFADSCHHEAIPVLIDWLDDYSVSNAGIGLDDIPVAWLAADALQAIGEPAIPYLLAHLEANLQTNHGDVIRVLQDAQHLPDMTLFITYYHYCLIHHPYLAENVRQLIEKHAPDTVLITDELYTALTETVRADKTIPPEILHQFVENGNARETVPLLISHLHAHYHNPQYRKMFSGRRQHDSSYHWDLIRLIRRIGTPLQAVQAMIILWRDIVVNIASKLGCAALIALPFVILGIGWAGFGWIGVWIGILICIAIPVVGLTILIITENRKNRIPLTPRKLTSTDNNNYQSPFSRRK